MFSATPFLASVIEHLVGKHVLNLAAKLQTNLNFVQILAESSPSGSSSLDCPTSPDAIPERMQAPPGSDFVPDLAAQVHNRQQAAPIPVGSPLAPRPYVLRVS